MNEVRKKSFNPGYVEKELSKVDKALTEKTVIYVIGGAVMALRGLKFGTKDVDVVLENRNTGTRIVVAVVAIAIRVRILRFFFSTFGIVLSKVHRLRSAYQFNHVS